MPNELVALGGAFVVAGLLARGGRRIGLPTIPLFMVAGIVTGPHTPGLVLVRDPHDLELFAAIGLVTLLFHLGLEFSIDDLMRGGSKVFQAGAAYLVLNLGGGLALGYGLGWGTREAFVIAGAVGISSTAIVTKLLVELKRLTNRETPMILGIIVVEDVFLALYLALLQPILGGAEGLAEGAFGFGKAMVFLIVLFALARYAGGWFGRLVDAPDDELRTVLFLGVAVLIAGVSEELGVSDAIGALMAGMILARSPVAEKLQRLVLPIRDAFAAVFFFTVGLSIDPNDAGLVWRPVFVAVLATFVLNLIAGAIAARIFRFDGRSALNAGLALVGRGEFSLILAALAVASDLDPRVVPFVALYVLVVATLGPLAATRSEQLAALVRFARPRQSDRE